MVGWCALFYSFQRYGHAIFDSLAGWNLRHLRQIWVGMGPFISSSLQEESQMTEILLIRTLLSLTQWIYLCLNVCFGCSKEPSQWDGSFEYPQHKFWLRNIMIINFNCPQLPVVLSILCLDRICSIVYTCLKQPLKKDQIKVLMENASLMKVESIAECSPPSFLQYFWPALSDSWSWKPILVFFLVAA